jgi:hypothetical protein
MSTKTTFNLKRALTSSGDGAALVPYDLSPVLEEELLALQPLAQLLEVEQAEAKTHEYNVRTSHPRAWFEGETSGRNTKTGAYARKSVQLKIQRIWGSVTGFAQAVDENFIDALAIEIEGSLEGMADAIEYGVLFGAADDVDFTGDAYQYSGIVTRVFADAPENVLDAAGAKIELDMLDQLLEKTKRHRQTRRDPGMFFMGIRMKQIVDGLQAKVQLPLQEAQLFDGKITMAAYADNPLFETEMMVPGDSSPALTSALASGGTLTDAVAYQHAIASVTMDGESVASALSTARTAGTGDNTVNLTWTADPEAVLYYVFRKAGAGDAQLIDVIPALTYNSDGEAIGVVEAYSDDGSKSAISQVKPLATGNQQVVLCNRNPRRGATIMSKVDDMGQPAGMVNFVETARVKDTYDYFLKSYLTLRMRYPNLFAVLRNVAISA